MYKPTTLRAYLLRALEAGVSPDQILKGSGVTWEEIERQETLDLNTISELFDLIARRAPEDFAIRCGNACQIRDFGIVGFGMMSMPTLRDAFQYLQTYNLLIGHPLVNKITEVGDEWCMQFVPSKIMTPRAHRFCAEVSIAAVEPVIAEMTDAPANSLRMEFSFERPSSLASYDLLGVREMQFGAQLTTYWGERRDLDRPIRSRDGNLCEIFRQESDRVLARMTKARSIRDRLEDVMILSAGGMPSLDEMAAALHMSRRSLQRVLFAESLSYQCVVRDFRVRQAKVLLSQDQANIKTIAHLLGFADTGSFRRAFHDWTGETVNNWKKQHADKAAQAKRKVELREPEAHAV